MMPNRIDRIYERYARRLQLLRGAILKLRGARAGERFGIGRHVQVWYPGCLSAGHDVTIFDGAYIRSARPSTVCIGNCTNIHMGFWLDCGADPRDVGFLRIGSQCQLQPYVTMNAGRGAVTIGDHVTLSQLVSIHAGNHVFEDPGRLIVEQGTTHQGVTIEDDCWIGAKATILDGVTIGRGCVIGAGAVVTRSIPPYSVAMGVPARVVRQRKPTVCLSRDTD